MPQATNLVVKNAAGVDKTFTLLSPAAGYGTPAEWALKEGAISTVFPRFTASARSSKRPTKGLAGKVVQIKLHMPSSYTDTVTGLTVVNTAWEGNANFSVPSDFPETLKPDAAAFFGNLVKTALLQAMMGEGTPAT